VAVVFASDAYLGTWKLNEFYLGTLAGTRKDKRKRMSSRPIHGERAFARGGGFGPRLHVGRPFFSELP